MRRRSLFLLTPLREGRRQSCAAPLSCTSHFYSRPCGRGDHRLQAGLPPHPRFLLTPLREGRLHRSRFFHTIDTISTHAPAGGATRRRRCCCTRQSNFYSRPCGRGDAGMRLRERSGRQISTHAPAGGATNTFGASKRSSSSISTHAPAGGATSQRASARAKRFISTHAPAGGATICGLIVADPNQFLLTPLREGRLEDHRRPHADQRNFYSRPCGRGDLDFPAILAAAEIISTHAPAGGATLRLHAQQVRFAFLLTPLREGRLVRVGVDFTSSTFLLTPLREGRR